MHKLTHNLRVVFCLLFITVSSSCTIFQQAQKNNETVFFELTKVPKQMIGQTHLEKFEFFGVVNRSMLVQSELTAKNVNLVAMTFEGLPIVQASWNTLTNEWKVLAGVALQLRPQQILHDLQSVHWPITVIETALFNNYSAIEGKTLSGYRYRHYYFKNVLVRTIEYKDDVIEFNDIRKNYQLIILH